MVAAVRALDFKITGSYFLEVNKSIYLIVPDGHLPGSKSPAPITWLDEVQSEIIRIPILQCAAFVRSDEKKG